MATEKRLIEAKDVKELINGLSELPWEEEVDYLVDELPTVDAVEVVRCKDCKKWYRHTEVDRERGECRRYQTTKHETGFCDRGERKDND